MRGDRHREDRGGMTVGTCETCAESKKSGNRTYCVFFGMPIRKDYHCERHRFRYRTVSIYEEEENHEQSDDYRKPDQRS